VASSDALSGVLSLPLILLEAAPEPNESSPRLLGGGVFRTGAALLAPIVAVLIALATHLLVPARHDLGTRWWNSLPTWRHPYPAVLELFLTAALFSSFVFACWRAARPTLLHNGPLAAGAIFILAIWDTITRQLDRELVVFFPTPDLVFGSIIEDWRFLLTSARQSLILLLCGYATGVGAGIGSGILVGWFPTVRYWAMPAMKFIGPIPATALIAFVMVLSTQSFLCGVILIAFVVWFPVTMLTSSGIASVRLSHLDVARTLGAGRFYLIFHVALPSAMPNIFLGLFMGLLASFLTLVVAETVGVEAGLGHYFKLVQGDLRYDKMYGVLFIMALFCSGLMTALFKVRDWMLRWQQGVIKW
jgi:NitT/TauT family transport system permease protein